MTTTAKPNPPAEHTKRTEEAARAARLAQNEIALAIENSHPAVMKRILHGAPLPAHAASGKKIKAECAEQAEFVQKIKSQLEAGVAALRAALDACTESGSYGDVFSAIEIVKINKAELAQEIVAAWSKAGDLAPKIAADIAPVAQQMKAEADALLEEVKAELTKLGSGLESQIAYGKNPQVAEQQFTFAARQNLRVRAATAKANAARAEQTAAAERVHAARRGLEAARDYLHKVVLLAVSH